MEKEIELLQRKLDTAVKHYNFLLAQKDKVLAGQLFQLETMYRHSWKWKIGNFVVESFIRVLNFIKNPVKFILNQDYRGTWHGHNSQASALYYPTNQEYTQFIQPPDPDEPVLRNQQELKEPPAGQDRGPASDSLKKQQTGARIDSKPVVAAILDEKSANALQPELTMVTFRPDTWQAMAGGTKPEALLVESTWRGNQGAWQYKIARTPGMMGNELQDLVHWAKTSAIPSMFWLTCNPMNEIDFQDVAKLFDFVLIPGTGNIGAYQKKYGHDRILSFPFAIQPAKHNPVLNATRDQDICLSGGLTYPDVQKSYHRSRVLLHTNQPGSSGTQATRRILESLACGTPVITTYPKSLHPDFNDLVLFTESESDTQRHLDLLLNDQLYWMKASVRGVRKVMEFHRYDVRLREVLKHAGIDSPVRTLPDICLVINITDGDNLVALVGQIKQQTYPPKAVVLLAEKEPGKALRQEISSLLAPMRVFHEVYYQNQLSKVICDTANCRYYAIWDAGDFYGPEYLKDYALATLFSDAYVFGKSNFYGYENGQLTEKGRDFSYRYTSSVPVSTLMLHQSRVASLNFLLLLQHPAVYDSFLTDVLSLDPLNFIQNLTGSTEIDDGVRTSLNA